MTVIAYSFWELPQIWTGLSIEAAKSLISDLKDRQYKVETMTDLEYEEIENAPEM